MTTPAECIFCRMASGEIPAEVVHSTARLIVVKDINPQAPTHLLVIPRKHYRNIVDCDDASLLGEMVATAAEVAREHGFAEPGFRTIINTNEEGGQTVWHLHMHIIAGRPLAGRMG